MIENQVDSQSLYMIPLRGVLMEKQNIPSLRPLLFIGCAGVCLALAFLWFFSSLSLAEERLLPVYRVKTQRPAVALTFDAAWGNQDMDQILSILKEYDASATFFITGDFARSYSQDVRKLFLAGHCVANHSDTHPHINALSQEKALSDTLSCNQILEDLTGERPKLYRGPYGEYNDRLLTMLDEKNMVCILSESEKGFSLSGKQQTMSDRKIQNN